MQGTQLRREIGEIPPPAAAFCRFPNYCPNSWATQFAQKLLCCLLSLFSLFSYCNISTMKRGDRERSGKWLPCHMERQSSSQEHRSFENMTLSTCTSPKGLTAYSTRQQFPLCCPSKALRMYFKISQWCVAAVILQESMPGWVSPACPATPADPVTGRQKTCEK